MELFKKLLTLLSFVFASTFSFILLCIVALFVFALVSVGKKSAMSAPLKLSSKNAVGVVDLLGEIVTADNFRKNFNKFQKNKKIKSIVVRIDSPGGAVGASEEIYRIIKNSKKPVVCSLGNVAASGGVYAAMGCDKVVSNMGTITGSIGVILFMPNVSQVVDKVGFKMNIVKSGKYKDAGSPFKEFGGDEQSLLQSLVSQSYEEFLKIVATNRNLPVDKVRKFADGRIILGSQALEYGLVDKIGGLEEAGKLALELADIKDVEPEFVFVSKPRAILEIFEQFEQKLDLFGYNNNVRLKYF